MKDPEGAILDHNEIEALYGTRCHLPIFVNGPDPWIVRSGTITFDSIEPHVGKSPLRIYIQFEDRLPNRYFFEVHNGYFPWGYQRSCLFKNYWLAWAFCQQLRVECIAKNLR